MINSSRVQGYGAIISSQLNQSGLQSPKGPGGSANNTNDNSYNHGQKRTIMSGIVRRQPMVNTAPQSNVTSGHGEVNQESARISFYPTSPKQQFYP